MIITAFLSTSSARRTTSPLLSRMMQGRISIHVLREEDDDRPAWYHHGREISIHVLREEDDADPRRTITALVISIHVLREEDDAIWAEFLSMPV